MRWKAGGENIKVKPEADCTRVVQGLCSVCAGVVFGLNQTQPLFISKTTPIGSLAKLDMDRSYLRAEHFSGLTEKNER